MAKSRKRRSHAPRGLQVTSQRKNAAKQLAQTSRVDSRPKEDIKSVRRTPWTVPASVLAIATLLVVALGLAIQVTRLNSQLDDLDGEKEAAEVAAAEVQDENFNTRQERDKALQDVARLQQQTNELKRQITSQQQKIQTQQSVINDPQKILTSQVAARLDLASKGSEISPGEEVKDKKAAKVTGNLVTSAQQPARFVAIDAWRADARIATTVSDKTGRFSMDLPPGDEVVLKFMAAGRMTSDITLSGKHNYHLKVLLVDRGPIQLQKRR